MPLDQREDTDPTHPLPPGGRIYRTHAPLQVPCLRAEGVDVDEVLRVRPLR